MASCFSLKLHLSTIDVLVFTVFESITNNTHGASNVLDVPQVLFFKKEIPQAWLHSHHCQTSFSSVRVCSSCHGLRTPFIPLPTFISHTWNSLHYPSPRRVRDMTIKIQKRESKRFKHRVLAPTFLVYFPKKIHYSNFFSFLNVIL